MRVGLPESQLPLRETACRWNTQVASNTEERYQSRLLNQRLARHDRLRSCEGEAGKGLWFVERRALAGRSEPNGLGTSGSKFRTHWLIVVNVNAYLIT